MVGPAQIQFTPLAEWDRPCWMVAFKYALLSAKVPSSDYEPCVEAAKAALNAISDASLAALDEKCTFWEDAIRDDMARVKMRDLLRHAARPANATVRVARSLANFAPQLQPDSAVVCLRAERCCAQYGRGGWPRHVNVGGDWRWQLRHCLPRASYFDVLQRGGQGPRLRARVQD